jgi:uncharacterized small protein (DUF1192 family)
MGLHTGEPAVHEEGYVGLDVVRAARICTLGRGGQILLSETTRALIGGGLPDGVTVFPLGQRHLRGIDEPERVYEIAIEGLEDEGDRAPGPPPARAPDDAAPEKERGQDLERRFEDLGARLAAGIQGRVLRSFEGTLGQDVAAAEAHSAVDDIASRMASLGDEISARIEAALARKDRRS